MCISICSDQTKLQLNIEGRPNTRKYIIIRVMLHLCLITGCLLITIGGNSTVGCYTEFRYFRFFLPVMLTQSVEGIPAVRQFLPYHLPSLHSLQIIRSLLLPHWILHLHPMILLRLFLHPQLMIYRSLLRFHQPSPLTEVQPLHSIFPEIAHLSCHIPS